MPRLSSRAASETPTGAPLRGRQAWPAVRRLEVGRGKGGAPRSVTPPPVAARHVALALRWLVPVELHVFWVHLPHATAPGGRRALTRGQRDRRLPATRLGCSLCHLAARDARGGAWPPSRHLRRQPCRPRAYRGRWLADHGPSPRRDGHIASSGTGSSTTGNRPPPSSSSSSSSAAPPPSAPTRLYTCCPPSCCRQAFARLALASSRPPPASPARRRPSSRAPCGPTRHRRRSPAMPPPRRCAPA